MPSWNSTQYLKFSGERTQPSIDLARRVALDAPARVVDLGCGPGNSTDVVARRWPQADVTGVDNSAAMLEQARKDFPKLRWAESDIASWAHANDAVPYDVVFSNAALQWVPAHAELLPALMDRVANGGALAVQVPANIDAPAHRLMRELAASSLWRRHFATSVREWHVHEPGFYYDTLAPLAMKLDLWITEYLHVMPDAAALLEWYRGTGLRPWLQALPDDATRERFAADYLRELKTAYPAQSNGRVLFPFRRLFFVAYR